MGQIRLIGGAALAVASVFSAGLLVQRRFLARRIRFETPTADGLQLIQPENHSSVGGSWISRHNMVSAVSATPVQFHDALQHHLSSGGILQIFFHVHSRVSYSSWDFTRTIYAIQPSVTYMPSSALTVPLEPPMRFMKIFFRKYVECLLISLISAYNAYNAARLSDIASGCSLIEQLRQCRRLLFVSSEEPAAISYSHWCFNRALWARHPSQTRVNSSAISVSLEPPVVFIAICARRNLESLLSMVMMMRSVYVTGRNDKPSNFSTIDRSSQGDSVAAIIGKAHGAGSSRVDHHVGGSDLIVQPGEWSVEGRVGGSEPVGWSAPRLVQGSTPSGLVIPVSQTHQGTGRGLSGNCFNCRQPGHHVAHCPYRRNNGLGRTCSSGVGRNGSHVQGRAGIEAGGNGLGRVGGSRDGYVERAGSHVNPRYNGAVRGQRVGPRIGATDDPRYEPAPVLVMPRLFNTTILSLQRERAAPAPAAHITAPAPAAHIAAPAPAAHITAPAPAAHITAPALAAHIAAPASASSMAERAPAPAPHVDPVGYKIHLGGIPWGWRRRDLLQIFHPYGVLDAEVPMRGRESRGIGFVTIAEEMDAINCIKEMHGRCFATRKISVTWAKPKEMRRR